MMKNYIIIYELWLKYEPLSPLIEYFETEIELEKRVNELYSISNSDKNLILDIIFSGKIVHEYKYEPIEYAVKYKQVKELKND